MRQLPNRIFKAEYEYTQKTAVMVESWSWTAAKMHHYNGGAFFMGSSGGYTSSMWHDYYDKKISMHL